MKILEMDLTPEDQKELSTLLKEWQEVEKIKMVKALNEAQKEKINLIEESLVSYKEELEEEYMDKVNVIIESLKPQIRKQILVEMNETNPDLLVMEKIKEIIFPLISEESGKAYTNEITLLKNELAEIKKTKELTEGVAKKEKLLENYTDKTKKILDKMIGIGSAEEITQKFYELVEQFQELEENSEPIIEETETPISKETEKVDIIDEDFEPTIETSSLEEETKKIKKEEKVQYNNFKQNILRNVG